LAQQQAREQANLREAQQRAASINAQRPGAIASGSQYAPLMQGEVRRPSGAYRAGEIAGIATLICMGLALMAYVFRKVVGG
jgi:hypothetical protein